jgi:transposase
MGLVERIGRRALKARRRGRPPVSRLEPHQAATTVRHIVSGCPDQLSLPFALWTREAVQELLSRKFDLQVSVWTVGRYLRAWGLTPQKPVRRAYEQNPAAVRKWLEEEYPSIREQARQFKAHIHWLDEMGLRSDHQAGRSYGRRGETPVVFGRGQRFRCNMISSITNRGRLAFMIFRQRFTARVFLNFLGRLLCLTRKTRRKVFLIVDAPPVSILLAPTDRSFWNTTRARFMSIRFDRTDWAFDRLVQWVGSVEPQPEQAASQLRRLRFLRF